MYPKRRLGKMDRCWISVVILSVFSVAVVAYRNDLSSSRHGCIWSTLENGMVRVEKGSSSGVSGGGGGGGGPIGGVSSVFQPQNGVMLNCHVRTLSMDFWNYTFNREQLEQTKLLRVECNDKLFFESFLSSNQTLFQLTNLRQVQIESCKIRKVPRRVWASLSFLKSLTIRTHNVDWGNAVGLEIEPGSFDGLSKLETLDLSENNIWSLGDKKMLCPLRNLLKLNVSRNRLSDIEELHTSESEDTETGESSSPDNYCAVSVTNVDLSFNSLRRVGRHGFSRMRRLNELRLQNNLIEELEDTAFHGLSQLKLVNLSSNRLVALPPYIFKSNSNLRELYLQNNSISALSPSVFSQLEQLLLLDLSYNTLTSQWIKDNMFTPLVRLVVLKLSFNQLSSIDSTIFHNLISLQALHLDNNRIETLHPEAFVSLSNLHILDLSRNRITFIDSRIFSRLFVLRQLYMDHNKIKDMDENSFKNCTDLQELGLGDNLLHEVPVALRSAGLGLLKTLDIGENRIISVNNETFSGMGQLYGLRMVDNRLSELPDGFCDPLKKLRVLNVAQNRIVKISATSFLACNELRALRLDTNALEQLPTTLSPQLPSLLYLNVSENRLSFLDYSSLPPSIEWLHLSYNSLESLGSPNPSLPLSAPERNMHNRPMPYRLRVLDVSHNALTHLDYTSIPASLETLRVNHNHLKNVAADTFIRSSQLRRVELIGNQLQNLPLAALRFPQIPSGRSLPEFYLGANPFLCDCTMEWLTRVNQLSVLRQHPRIVDLDAIVCRPSFSRANSVVPLVETKPKDFLCEYQSHCFALCHCCDFEACDCQMTCPGNCTCFHDTAWSSNIVQCSNLDYTEIPERIPMDATEIYLDGNNIPNLSSHIFIGKKNLKSLFLNGSHIEFIKNKTFNGLKTLEILRLEDNSLTQLHGYEFADVENLLELYLQNNLLRFISANTFSQLKFLKVLRLDGNILVDFNVWELSGNGRLNSVMLAGNPWSCECEFLIPFRSWVAGKSGWKSDFLEAKCQGSDAGGNPNSNSSNDLKPRPTISSMCNNLPELTFNYNYNVNGEENDINNQISAMGDAEKVAVAAPEGENDRKKLLAKDLQDYNLFWSLLVSLSALLIVVMVIVLIFRRELSYTCINLGSLCCAGKSAKKDTNTIGEDTEKLFDAYFLYSKKDEDVLQEKIAPELESIGTGSASSAKFRLCFHYRDLCLNSDNPWNSEMILSACDASKRVVVVFSQSFLQTEWANVHFRAAIQTALSRHQKKIVFILLPPLTTSNLSTLLSDSKGVDGNSTSVQRGKNSNVTPPSVQWTDKNFWTKFKLLLPAPSFSNYSDNCELPLNARHFPYNSTHHYHRNIIPYQIPLSRNNSLPPESVVPKHQIVLPGHHWSQNNNPNNIIGGGGGRHHQHHHTGSTPIHPVPSQVIPMHFGYNNEAFHHQHLLLQPPETVSRQMQLQPIHFAHEHQHSHSSSSYRPILDQYSSSAVSSGNEHEDMDHVYSTLDSPLQSPMSGDSHFDLSLHSQTQSHASHSTTSAANECHSVNGKHKLQHSTSSGISSASDLTAVTGTSPGSLAPMLSNNNNSDNHSEINNKNCNSGGAGGPGNGQMYFV